MLCKLSFYHCALGHRVYRQGSFTSLIFEGVAAVSCLWDIFFCRIAFFSFLRVYIRNISHYCFKLWDITTPNHRSPEPGKRNFSDILPHSLLPHMAWQFPSSFFIYCEKGIQCFVSEWKQDDLNMFSHTCMTTSRRWDSCQICPVLLPLGVYENTPQPPEPLPIPLLSWTSTKWSLQWQPNIYTISFCRFSCCLSAWSVPRTPQLGMAALPSASLNLSTVSWALKLDNRN